MTTHVPPTAGPAGAAQYAGAPGPHAGAPGAYPAATGPHAGGPAPHPAARTAQPWYRRLRVLITGGIVAVLLVFGSGYAAGVFATSMRGPGDMSFEQGDRGPFPGGPGSGELPDGSPGSGSSSGSGT